MTLARKLVPVVRQRAIAVEQAVADVNDATLWHRPAPGANPMGNLVLHLAGNLMQYIARGVGGRAYDRDRPYEFQATGLPRDEILGRFREAVDAVIEVLDSVDAPAFAEPYEGPEFAGDDKERVMLHSIEHLGYHTGQLVLLARLGSLARGGSEVRRTG